MPDYAKYTAVLMREREWRRLNPELWEQEVVGFAMAEAAAGRKFSTSAIVERLRWRDRVDREGNNVQVDDHFSPLWSRILVKYHPELEPFVVQKRTPWDDPELKELIS